MGKKLWLDADGRARENRRLERVSDERIDRVYTAYRLLEADAKHVCVEEKDGDGFCAQDRVAMRVARTLVFSG